MSEEQNKGSEANTGDSGDTGVAPDVTALQAQLSDYKKKLWKADEATNHLKEKYKGIDPEEVRAKLEDYDNMRRNNVAGEENREEFDRLLNEEKDKLTKDFGSKLDEVTAERDKYKQRADYYEVVIPMRELGKDFLPEAFKYLDDEFSKFCRKHGDEIVIVDKDGEIRKSQKDPRLAMSPDEFIEELKELNPFMVRSNVKTGHMPNTGEKTNGSTNAGGMTYEAFKKLSKAEQSKIPPKERVKIAASAFQNKG